MMKESKEQSNIFYIKDFEMILSILIQFERILGL